MTTVLLWKEYRQQRAVWLAILFLAIVLVVSIPFTMGHGNGWQTFQDERLQEGLNGVLLILIVSYGVVSGALLLASESEEGTLAFLDSLSGWRGPLWARKAVAGAILTLSLSVALDALAVGLGFASWQTVLVLPILGLDALVWGLLGGALCRKVLTAVLTGIALMAFTWTWLPLLWNSYLAIVLCQTAMALVGAYFSWRRYSSVDRSRQLVAGRVSSNSWQLVPVSGRVLVWLAFRQGRWILAACLVGALLLGLTVHFDPLVLWPMGTLLLGLVCGLSVFVPDQSEGVHFLGAQRFPVGRVWTVRILFWGGILLGLTILSWAVDIGGGGTLHSSSRSTDELRGYRWFDDLGKRAELISSFVFFGLWPLYGFCFGQFFAQILRRPVLAVILAVFVTPVVVSLWIPSLLFGGVPLWQLLIPPVVLLSLTRLNQYSWMSERLFNMKPLIIISGGVALMDVALVGCFWYRAVEVPELDEPFDVSAYLATLPSPEQNEAGLLVRRAGIDLRDHRSKVEKELGPPKEPIFSKAGGGPAGPPPVGSQPAGPPPVGSQPAGPPPVGPPPVGPPMPAAPPIPGPPVSAEYTYDDFLNEIQESGWPIQEKELGRWLDRLFEDKWVEEAQKAAHLPLSMVADPRIADVWGQFGYLMRDCSGMARLFTARALQLQAHGDSQAALNHLETALALSRHVRNAAPVSLYATGVKMETIALTGMRLWLQNLGPNKELLQVALSILKHHEAAVPDPVNTIKSQYLLDRKRELPINRPTNSVDELLVVVSQVPWEKERQLRLSRALTRAWTSLQLRNAQQPVWKTITGNYPVGRPPFSKAPMEKENTAQVAGAAGLPPPEGVGANRSAYQWGEWIQQFEVDEKVSWLFDDPWFAVANSQLTLRLRLLVTASAFYQVEHGKAPAQLEDLVPTYLPALPEDPWIGKPFGYRISRGEMIVRETSPLILAPGQGLIFTEHSNRVSFYSVPIWNKWFP